VTASFDETVHSRRSVRVYDRREVSERGVREILDLSRHAPSSMDGQPCCFVVVRDATTRKRLAEIKNLHCPPEKRAYPADFLAGAPVIVAVCVERVRAFGRTIENGVLATAFMLLAARSRGLTSVYLSAYNNDDPGLAAEIRELLQLPANIDPVTLVPLGYPGAEPASKGFRPLEDIVHYERFEPKLRASDRHPV
jgi:nitroreductase